MAIWFQRWSRLKIDSCDFEIQKHSESWEQKNEVTINKLADSQSFNCIVFCKIAFECRTLNCFLLCQLRKKSPDFFPVLTPQEDGIFFIIIFHMQSLHMQESFSTKERLTFQAVLWKMLHIIRSLTHYIDVSACLYKDLEQSVLATELTSKLFDPKFLHFDSVIMYHVFDTGSWLLSYIQATFRRETE